MIVIVLQLFMWAAAIAVGFLGAPIVWLFDDGTSAFTLFLMCMVFAWLVRPTDQDLENLKLFQEQRQREAETRADVAAREAEYARKASSTPVTAPGSSDQPTQLAWDELKHIALRVGAIVAVEPITSSRKPAYELQIDFGPAIGTLTAVSRITELYTPDALIGKRVVAVTNLPEKQIGSVRAQCLVTGFPDHGGKLSLCTPDHDVQLGARLR